MPIQAGETIPAATLTLVNENGPEEVSTDTLFHEKKVVLFGVPGAFTPTCSEAHLPGFVNSVDVFSAKGIDTIACITVNDPFVVSAWAKAQNVKGVVMLADGNADYVTALGMNIDMTARGFGMRSSRFAMIIDNGKVTYVAQETIPKDHGISSAESILNVLS